MPEASPLIRAVHRIATGLFSRPRLDEILPEVVTVALESVGALAGTLYLHDPKDDTLIFSHVVGGDPGIVGVKIPSSTGIAGVVFRSGKSMVTGDASQDSRHRNVSTTFHTKSMATVPLSHTGGRRVGVLQVLNKRDLAAFTEEHDIVILETLAILAATAIENAQQAERQRKAAVADAVGDIAHDIKNMMTPVEGWAMTLGGMAAEVHPALERLERSALPEQADDLGRLRGVLDLMPEAVEGIKDGAQQVKDRGAEIADALLGKVRTPQFVTEDAVRTVARVCRTLQNGAEARGINLRLEGAIRPFPHDRTHLFNALYNLVNNAIPYVPSGGSIRVEMSEQGPWAQFAVIDTGAGMPEAVRRSLFTESVLSTTEGGTGLGTTIVLKVAQLHGGEVTVESELGKGSSFTLRLPLERPA